jgi:outer membrane lipoprotein carrier protein
MNDLLRARVSAGVTMHRALSAASALLGFLLGAVPLRAQATDAVAVLDAAAARYRASSAVCADFTQQLENPLLRQTHTGRGRICQKPPNLFMMRFTEPAGDVMVSDGRFFWRYLPSADRSVVTQLPLDRVAALDPYREFLQDTSRKYDARRNGQEVLEGSQANRVVLVPKQPTSYREAELWIDARSSLLRRVQLREDNGVVRTISLTNIALNATPPAGAFSFTPPPGTQVIKP